MVCISVFMSKAYYEIKLITKTMVDTLCNEISVTEITMCNKYIYFILFTSSDLTLIRFLN